MSNDSKNQECEDLLALSKGTQHNVVTTDESRQTEKQIILESDSYLLRDCMVKSCFGTKRFDIMCPLQCFQRELTVQVWEPDSGGCGVRISPFVFALTD